MKKFLLASAALVATGMSIPAIAADMPVKAIYKAPLPVVYAWTGCYIGGNIGSGRARTDQSQIATVGGAAIVPPNDFGNSQNDHFIGGGQIGCDYQFAGNFVVGVQGMFDFGRFSSTHVVPTAFPGFPVGSFISQNDTKNVFTATGRVGYLFLPQVLGYIKGGAAWTRADHTFIGTVPVTFLSENALGISRQGWTVGGGLEWMFMHGWSMFGEYNYMDFGRKDINFVAGPATVGAPDVIRTRLEIQQVLVGINYKFGWGGGVVANY
jgi:outer membrane immunogenic protein